MNDYEIITQLGEGAFSEVYKVQHKRTGKLYAMKMLKLDDDGDDNDDIADDELSAFRTLLYHDNVVQCCNVIRQGGIKFIVEYCSLGTLDEFFIKYSPGVKRRYTFIREIAAGVAHLHKNNLIHRDLKPDNIFITGTPSTPKAKIGDFGLAKFASDAYNGTMYEFYMTTLAGTIYFLGPEVYDGHYTAKADIFSMGLIFAAIICYQKYSHDGLYLAIYENGRPIAPAEALRGGYDIDPLLNPAVTLPTQIRTLIMAMLKEVPRLRPSADKVEQIVWDASPTEDESWCILS